MSYGWLSETTLTLKKPKAIKISDKSNEPLRQIINEHLSKDKKNNKSNSKNIDLINNSTKSKSNNTKSDSNKGVKERNKRDRELKRESSYKRVLAKKAELYEKIESGDPIKDKESLKLLNNSLVDFRKKSIMNPEPNSMPDGGAPCMYTTPNVITNKKSNIDELRSKLAKIKQSKQNT